jgi:hypothetical protein
MELDLQESFGGTREVREMDATISGFAVLGDWNCVEKKWHGKHSIEFVVDSAAGLPLNAKVTLRIEIVEP